MTAGRLAVLLAGLTTALLLLGAWSADRAEDDLAAQARLAQQSATRALAVQLAVAPPAQQQALVDAQVARAGGTACLQKAGRTLLGAGRLCPLDAAGDPSPVGRVVVGLPSTLRADVAQVRVAVYGVHVGLAVLLGLLVLRLGGRQDDAVVAEVARVLRSVADGDLAARVSAAGDGERARLVGSTNAVAERLQVTVERQRTFLADAAHQLRNPLSALHLRAENLEPHVAPPGARGHARLLDDVARLERTLDELVVFARADEQEADAQVVDVLAVVQERLLGWLPKAYARGVLIRQLLPQQAVALSRPGALQQALDVVLDNALKHAPARSEVTVLVVPSATHVEVRVEDRGKGLPAGAREVAALRGWRSDPRDAGSGLGLAIASLLITSSGGRLELADRLDGPGLSAVVRLPTPAVVLVDDPRPAWARQEGRPSED